ncbi:glycosyl hydrolase family 28-related protein [Kocuria sp.]|uniref:glycosyl hydrolase family 28-related protein n=1 Tax=Kocuria sp. TaxID=1871328 RepID=UPI0026DF0195|nr:glycosyl hydrolase family 28-related protein [Kocuria sp.]MDO5619264.1 glycosyl hydrolase family 28-related protein [Kocuria sp.]
MERILVSAGWRDRQANVALVSDYGAIGNGVADDTAAIQAALNNTKGAPVEFSSAGTYKISGTLNIPSGRIVRGNGARIVSDRYMHTVFAVAGTADPLDVNLVGSYNAGAHTLRTAVPHRLTVGETFRLVGQRCAASIDAPPSDRLGMSTSNTGTPWFGEYLTVREVPSPTEVVVSSGLIFNGYRDNKTQETHTNARERTTLNRITWNENTLIEGFSIAVSNTYSIRLELAKDCVVRDITETRPNDIGYVVGTCGAYRCLVQDVHTKYASARPDTVNYYARNQFKVMNSQQVVIDRCTADGGSQVVDMTYLSAFMIPTIACVVRNCTFTGFDSNGVTLHPGVWGAIIENNEFRFSNFKETASGIGVRAPYSVIRNNRLRGAVRTGTTGTFLSGGSYGIHCFDGGGHHLLVTGNTVEGFDYSFGSSDGNEVAERHGELHIHVEGNYFHNFLTAIRIIRGNAALSTTWTALSVAGNWFSTDKDDACGIHTSNGTAQGTRGMSITGNHMHFSGSRPIPVRVGARTRDPIITGNVVTGTATFLIETQPGANNGTIATAANVVAGPSGTQMFPALAAGTGPGAVQITPDTAVAGAYWIGD